MSDDFEEIDNYGMPRFSWDYEDLSEAEQWFLMARAYLDCSKQLISQMTKEEFESSFYHAKAVVALFNHALELFLKGGIIQVNKPIANTHNLQELYNQFRNLYPGKNFEFEGDIVNAVRSTTVTPYNQYARYPTDLGGQTWQTYTHIELVTWYNQIRRFARDFERLEPLLKQRYHQKLDSSDTT